MTLLVQVGKRGIQERMYALTARKHSYADGLRIGSYRFFFYSGDRDEPRHVHVERDDMLAKFRLDPVRLQKSGGFAGNEITPTDCGAS